MTDARRRELQCYIDSGAPPPQDLVNEWADAKDVADTKALARIAFTNRGQLLCLGDQVVGDVVFSSARDMNELREALGYDPLDD